MRERRGVLNQIAIIALVVATKDVTLRSGGVWRRTRVAAFHESEACGARCNALGSNQHPEQRLKEEGALRPGQNADTADLLWTLTSLDTWENLVLVRGWTAAQYEKRLTDLLLHVLVGVER
jgi:hypothetical protein